MTERKPPGLSWDSFVEHQIQEAQRAGKFDNLPGFGRPIPGIDEPYDELGWLKKKAREENLSLLPPALEIRRDVAQSLEKIMQLSTESEVRLAVEAVNEHIRRATFAVGWGPATTSMPLDVDSIVSRWRSIRRRDAASE